MSIVTGAMYGVPPLTLGDMTAGATPASSPVSAPPATAGGTPVWHFAIPVYGVVLLVVAGLYAWSVWRE